jgi:hypothetical protein
VRFIVLSRIHQVEDVLLIVSHLFWGILGATMCRFLIISHTFSLSDNCSFLPLDAIISEQLKVLKTSFSDVIKFKLINVTVHLEKSS